MEPRCSYNTTFDLPQVYDDFRQNPATYADPGYSYSYHQQIAFVDATPACSTSSARLSPHSEYLDLNGYRFDTEDGRTSSANGSLRSESNDRLIYHSLNGRTSSENCPRNEGKYGPSRAPNWPSGLQKTTTSAGHPNPPWDVPILGRDFTEGSSPRLPFDIDETPEALRGFSTARRGEPPPSVTAWKRRGRPRKYAVDPNSGKSDERERNNKAVQASRSKQALELLETAQEVDSLCRCSASLLSFCSCEFPSDEAPFCCPPREFVVRIAKIRSTKFITSKLNKSKGINTKNKA